MWLSVDFTPDDARNPPRSAYTYASNFGFRRKRGGGVGAEPVVDQIVVKRTDTRIQGIIQSSPRPSKIRKEKETRRARIRQRSKCVVRGSDTHSDFGVVTWQKTGVVCAAV